MQHVADDADFQALEALEVIPQRQQVQQALRGMLVRAVAGIDDVGLDAVRQKVRRARRAVADDHHVDAHGFEIARRVHEGLALGHAGP